MHTRYSRCFVKCKYNFLKNVFDHLLINMVITMSPNTLKVGCPLKLCKQQLFSYLYHSLKDSILQAVLDPILRLVDDLEGM